MRHEWLKRWKIQIAEVASWYKTSYVKEGNNETCCFWNVLFFSTLARCPTEETLLITTQGEIRTTRGNLRLFSRSTEVHIYSQNIYIKTFLQVNSSQKHLSLSSYKQQKHKRVCVFSLSCGRYCHVTTVPSKFPYKVYI